jgi:tetratricopeptide (TPR) repeat protein
MDGTEKKDQESRFEGSIFSLIALGLGLGVCLWLTWIAACDGQARLFAVYGKAIANPDVAQAAARLDSADPESHYAIAVAYSARGKFAEAAREFEQAIERRPQDYFFWLELGRARDQLGDRKGSLAALHEAVRLAPHYSRPRWELGNVLLREGRLAEAFEEILQAARSDTALLPAVCDLVWQAGGRDAQVVEDTIRPRTPREFLTLSRFFATHGHAMRSLQLLAQAAGVPEQGRRDLLNDLLNAGEDRAAYAIWAKGNSQAPTGPEEGTGLLYDGGFELGLESNEPGFGWHSVGDRKVVDILRDDSQHSGGNFSVLLHWHGEPDPARGFLTQRVLVKPGARYKLQFATCTRGLVSGGLPILTLSYGSQGENEIARSLPLDPKTGCWQENLIEFTAPEDTDSVLIAVKRGRCARGVEPCPIFGNLWLDDFKLEMLERVGE